MSIDTQPEMDFSLSVGASHRTGHSLMDIMRRRFLVALAITIIVWAASTVIGIYRQKTYRATALLLVTQPQKSQNEQIPTPAWTQIQSEVPIHLQLVKRAEIATQVRQAIGLDVSVGYLLSHVNCEELPGTGQTNLLSLAFDDTTPERAQKIVNAWAASYVEDVRQRGVGSVTAALSYVQTQLGVVGGKLGTIEGRLADVQVQQQRTGVSQEALAALVGLKSALADNQTEQAAVSAQLQQLNGLIGRGKGQLKVYASDGSLAQVPQATVPASPASRSSSREVREASLVVFPSAPPNTADGGVTPARASDTGSRPAGSGRSAALVGGPHRTYGASQPVSATAPSAWGQSYPGQGAAVAQPSELALSLAQQISQLRGRRQQLSETYYEDSPQVKALDEQMRRLQRRYAQAVGAVKVEALTDSTIPLKAQQASLQARSAVLRDQLGKQEQMVGLLPGVQMNLDELERQRAVLQQVNSMLLSKQEELQVQKAMAVPNVQVVEYSELPTTSMEPRLQTLSGIGLILGLLLGLTLAIVIDQIEDTFGEVEEIRPYTGVPVLGAIAGLTDNVLAGPDLLGEPRSAFSNSVRMLGSMLRMEMDRRGISSVLVTSAGGEVGKTTAAASLACVLAGAGARVLIVEGDMHKLDLHRWFGVANDGPGLSGVLSRRATLEEAIVETSVPGLRLLPGGRPPATPADLLATADADEAIAEINAAADLVVWDTPPAAFLPDAAVLAQHAGGVLFVVGRKDRRRMVREALTSMKMVGARVIGIVPSGVRPAGGYRYGYHYPSRRKLESEN